MEKQCSPVGEVVGVHDDGVSGGILGRRSSLRNSLGKCISLGISTGVLGIWGRYKRYLLPYGGTCYRYSLLTARLP